MLKDILQRYKLYAIAVVTFGAWGPKASAFISELGRRIVVATGDPRSTAFLRQRSDVALQRGIAASVMGTLVEVSPVGD